LSRDFVATVGTTVKFGESAPTVLAPGTG
jgi:hypothetical protein